MKICLFQPPYPASGTAEAAEQCIAWMQGRLDALEPNQQDLVLLPEYATVPGIQDPDLLRTFSADQGNRFLKAVKASATRLKSAIALGTVQTHGPHWVNRSLFFGPDGNLLAHYDKVHLTETEQNDLGIHPGSNIEPFEYAGARLAFAVCFDLYFPEYFSALAAQQTDLILCPSYQRSETAQRIYLISQTRALDSGAYLARSSYAMSTSDRGGQSLIAGPDGILLLQAGSVVGTFVGELDPTKRFTKPASHGQPDTEHRDLMERRRRPTLYRPAQDSRHTVSQTPFPRLCAHRGISHACPENTLPAFAASLAAGVQEIELDLRPSRDGVPVVCHDPDLSRTTTGEGHIDTLDWADIRRLDAGTPCDPRWRGVPIPRFEEVLDLMDNKVALNIHIKDPGPDGVFLKSICDLLRERALTDIAYLALGTEEALGIACEYAPEIPRACLAHQKEPVRMIETAQSFACERLQFFRAVTPEQIQQAHNAGLICNLFWADECEDALNYVRNGIHVILTNCAHELVADNFFERATDVWNKQG
ncbi:MAG: glycerophosphodiester phosphodiesterase family protein [bacterium]|nr:glycerophosphodiester phosphodiesterase family protein [bacterium]